MPLPTISATPLLRRAAAIVGAAVLLSPSAGCSFADINDHYTDVEVLAEFESQIAASVEQVGDFPGFGTRFRQLSRCFYGPDHNEQSEDVDHSSVSLGYTLADEYVDDEVVVQAIAADFERYWTELGWEVDAWRDESTGEYYSVTGTAGEGVTLLYQAGSIVSLDAFHSGCVAIDDDPIEKSDPIGGVPPSKDRFENFSNRSNPDDQA